MISIDCSQRLVHAKKNLRKPLNKKEKIFFSYLFVFIFFLKIGLIKVVGCLLLRIEVEVCC